MAKKKFEVTEKVDMRKLINLPPEELLEGFIDPLAEQLATELDSFLLTLYYPVTSEVEMRPPDVSLVYNLLREIDKSEKLTVFLHSGGGDIHTAYKLVKLFQRCCEYRSLIPEYAKSAATLVAIGADKILMSPIAELGPLDPIIQLGEEGIRIPGFAIRNAPKILENEIKSCKDPEVRRLKAEHILGPIAVKIDPYLLADVYDTPELAMNYGKKILQARRYSASSAERICKRLTELGHPSHGYVIGIEEAKELGLRAEEMTQNIEQMSSALLLLLSLYENALQRDGHPLNSPFIKLYPPKRTKKRKVKVESKKNKNKKETNNKKKRENREN